MDLGLDSKLILITGASSGIGKAVAELICEESGSVILLARNREKLKITQDSIVEKNKYSKIYTVSADCSDLEALAEQAHFIRNNCGELDGLVINVGDGRSGEDAIPPIEIWNKTWKENFDTALNSARTFIPLLNPNGGSVVFVSSIAGSEAIGAPTDYSTAKAAVIAFAKNLSTKLAPNIRVNTVLPGNVLTNGGTWESRLSENPAGVNRMLNEKVPLRRLASPEEIAVSIIFLMSERSSFTTGAVLRVDGGQSVGYM
jgi:3-oxoacyl-[acyl-carrier protein] reductase